MFWPMDGYSLIHQYQGTLTWIPKFQPLECELLKRTSTVVVEIILETHPAS